MQWFRRVAGVSLLFFPLAVFVRPAPRIESQGQVTAPAQTINGPGGTADSKFKVQKSSEGTGATQYWVFEPQEARGAVPVIVFLHAWNALDPAQYGAWIDHLVQRGNIVIYPAYQEGVTERIPAMTPNALEAVRSAFSKLGSRADRSRFALVGHSLGSVLAFNIAALGASEGLPAPKALLAVMPADTDADGSGRAGKAAARGNELSANSQDCARISDHW